MSPRKGKASATPPAGSCCWLAQSSPSPHQWLLLAPAEVNMRVNADSLQLHGAAASTAGSANIGSRQHVAERKGVDH